MADSHNTVSVVEIFKSIQGESTWAGTPCVFVRLAGCNLRCTFCDTRYAHEGGREILLEDVLAECERLRGNVVEITGGEPVLQPGCAPLAVELIGAGKTVLVETNGSQPLNILPSEVVRIIDLKCPGSGENDSVCWENLENLRPRDEIKFVVADRMDYDWGRGLVERYDLVERCHAVLFAPVFRKMEPARLAKWILQDGMNVRLQLQQHKYIWAPDARGV